MGWFFIDIFGFINSFGLALFVERDMVSLYEWELVRCPGKSKCAAGGKPSTRLPPGELVEQQCLRKSWFFLKIM